MNNNKIKVLFYKIEDSEASHFSNELLSLGYYLEYKTVDTLNLVKSELMNFQWDVIVLENGDDNSKLEEILDFINDINSKTTVLVISEKIDKSILQMLFKQGKNDIVPKNDTYQVCLALVRNYEKTKDLNEAEFTKKELLRNQKTQFENEYFLNQVIESTSNPIFYKGIEGRYLGCNKAFAEFLGLSKEKIIGKTVFDVSPPNLSQKYFEMDQEFFKNPVTQKYEYKVANVQGKIMDVMFYKTAIRDEAGNVTGLLGHMFDITDRKVLERNLKKEKELAQNILDTSNEMFISLDLDGKITSANKKACEVLKYEKSNLVGKNWFNDIISKNEIELSKKVFKEIINNEANLNELVERKIITYENEELKIAWRISQIKDPEGKITGILTSGREIYEENFEQQLELSERRYQLLIENMQEGIGIVDLNENVIFSNSSFDKIFGEEPGKMVGKSLKDYIVEQELDKVFKETNLRKNNRSSIYKLSIKRKDKKERVINVSSVPWKNDNDEIIGTIGMVIDITSEEYSNKMLKKKEQIEQSIIRISSQFISTENFKMNLEKALQELFKIIEAERYGILTVKNNKLFMDIEQQSNKSRINGDDFEQVDYQKFDFALKMLNTLDFIFIDDVTKLPDEAREEKALFEKYKIFNFLGIPFYNRNSLAGILTISNIYEIDEWTIEDLSLLRTVSEIIGHAYSRKEAEEKAEKLKQDLITKNKELEQVVYVTSHDIRSPVINILGFSEEMTKALSKLANKIFEESNTINNREDIEFLLNKDVPQILNFIKISGQKIDKLLLALLKLSRLGRAAVNKVNVDMNKLVNSIIDTFKFKIEQENIKIEIGELPNCFTDEVQINQVFSNLIDNAIKYRSPERDCIIKISAYEHEEKITYCIEDNGIGISEPELDKIFDVFYRIDPENQEGEGIGLALIKKTLERLNGEISVGSTEGRETKFNISLKKQKQ